jgi:hypothetical protein
VADDAAVADLLSSCTDPVRRLALEIRSRVRTWLPDAIEEIDTSPALIAFTYLPGSYRGLVVAVAPHAAHVNLMFSRGAELVDGDSADLLEGTGKRARHIRFIDPELLDHPGVRALVEEAARRTPRQ